MTLKTPKGYVSFDDSEFDKEIIEYHFNGESYRLRRNGNIKGSFVPKLIMAKKHIDDDSKTPYLAMIKDNKELFDYIENPTQEMIDLHNNLYINV